MTPKPHEAERESVTYALVELLGADPMVDDAGKPHVGLLLGYEDQDGGSGFDSIAFSASDMVNLVFDALAALGALGDAFAQRVADVLLEQKDLWESEHTDG